ncbi:TIM-barrel domain-containing protein [Flavobacterium sp.]|uniref:glycoside hydrolase family 31 protein n=1 Tax=Flavobacterium sp. TaxID=239 RepID=UPI00261C89AC|nr:TIM-barrel domain-containing protein [Flavobacterium sp.]
MKKVFILLLFTTLSFAQNADRKFIEIKNISSGFSVKVSDGNYLIHFLNDKIVETSFIPNGKKNIKPSDAVILKNKLKNIAFKENKNSVECSSKSSNLKVVIQKSPFKISYLNNNVEIISEKSGYLKRKHIPLENVKGNITADSTEVLQFNISSDEVLYGGGARALGMNRRGNKLALYNRAQYGYETRAELMNFCIPLVLSSKLYAVHFDNEATGYLDLDSKKDNTLEYETISGRKTYQVIVGNSWEDLVKNYTDLTGKQPLPPRWAFGNFSSRFGYHTQEEVEKTIRKFEESKIPVDAIILDLYWFGKTVQGTMGNLEWDKDNFPNPDKMIADLNAKGVKTVLITEPFILTTSSKWQETVDKKVLATLNSEVSEGKPATWDFYFGNTGIVDVFKPEGKEWFWNVYKRLINQGVAGLWGDLGEPEVFPSYANTFAGTADEVHNVYGHNWAKLIADGYKKDFSNQRPFILMRSGYSGSQRFGMIPWSGDVSRSWGGLQSQMEIALQMGMQGMAYMHSDLGGFAGDYFDNELYLRWLQYGVFNPIFRPHAQEDVASEVAYKDVDTKEIAKKAVELRYQMLPYNYNLAYENSTLGKPLMQPLFFNEPNNKELLSKADGYLWGNDFLVYPIIEKGQTQKEVYFPKNSNWYDFYTGKKYEAGTTQKVELNKNNIPTFVRGNVFYPMTKLVQNTNSYTTSDLDLHYYFEGKPSSEREFYFDDGKTPDTIIDAKDHEILNCSTELIKNQFFIRLESKTENQELLSKGKNGTIFIYKFENQPKKVLINGKNVDYKYDLKTKSLEIKYNHSSYKTDITITF